MTQISGMIQTTDKVMEYLIKTSSGHWFCKECGKNGKSKSHLEGHVESKHYSPWYPCKANCGKTFKMKNSLLKHERMYCTFRKTKMHSNPDHNPRKQVLSPKSKMANAPRQHSSNSKAKDLSTKLVIIKPEPNTADLSLGV